MFGYRTINSITQIVRKHNQFVIKLSNFMVYKYGCSNKDYKNNAGTMKVSSKSLIFIDMIDQLSYN